MSNPTEIPGVTRSPTEGGLIYHVPGNSTAYGWKLAANSPAIVWTDAHYSVLPNCVSISFDDVVMELGSDGETHTHFHGEGDFKPSEALAINIDQELATSLAEKQLSANQVELEQQLIPDQADDMGADISFDVGTFLSDEMMNEGCTIHMIGMPPGLDYNPGRMRVEGTLADEAVTGDPYTVSIVIYTAHGEVLTSSFSWTIRDPKTVDQSAVNTVAVPALNNSDDGASAAVLFAVATQSALAARSFALAQRDTSGNRMAPRENADDANAALFSAQASGGNALRGGEGDDRLIDLNGQELLPPVGNEDDSGLDVELAVPTNGGGAGRFGRTDDLAVPAVTNGDQGEPLSSEDVAVAAGVVSEDGNALPFAGRPSGVTALEDTERTNIDLLGSAFDVDGDDLTITQASAQVGTVTINADGSINYLPPAEFSGTDRIVYTVDDGNGGSDTSEFEISVLPVNDAPVAAEGQTSVGDEDTVQAGIEVLAGAFDQEGDGISVLQASASHGQVSINGDGTLSYTPDQDFFGTDTITYIIADGNGGEATGEVAVEVTSINDAPDANVPVGSTAVEDTTLTGINLLGNVSDVDGDTVTVIAGTFASSRGGVAVINADGTLDYTPPADFFGTDTVTYQITDGHPNGMVTATLQLEVTPVNDAPDIVVPLVADQNEDAILASIDVLDQATDVENDTLAVTIISDQGGTATVNPDGSIRFVADADYNGPAVIDYLVNDGTPDPANNSTAGQITFNILPVNDAPQIVVPSVADVAEDGVIAAIDVLDQATDTEGDMLSVSIVSSTGGTASVNPDGTIRFEADADYNGPATVDYLVNDGTPDPANNSTAGQLTFNVTPVNDAPQIVVPTVADIAEDGTIAALDVLDQAVDVEGDPLSVSIVSSSGGTASLNPDGTIRFEADADYNGPAVIDYLVNDGTPDPANNSTAGQITFNILPVNDAPQIVVPSVADVAEDGVIAAIDVLDQATDTEGDTLSVSIVSSTGGTASVNPDGTIRFEADADYNGPATVDYRVNDGTPDPANNSTAGQLTFNVTPVNDAPQIVVPTVADIAEDGTIAALDVLDQAVDVEGDPLSVSIVSSSGGTASLNPDGTIRFEADADYTGPASVDYVVNDGTPDPANNSTAAKVSFNILPVNDAPVPATLVGQTTAEDVALVNIDVLSGATDADGDTIFTVNGSASSREGGVVTTNPDGTLSYTPPANFVGQDEITYQIDDGNLGGLVTSTFLIDVTAVNDAPVLDLSDLQNVVRNSEFTATGPADWDDWTETGSFDSQGISYNAPSTSGFSPSSTSTLAQSGLSGLATGPGAFGAGRVQFDAAWNNADLGGMGGSSQTLTLSIGGVDYFVLTTPSGNGATASISYLNGASGTPASLNGSTMLDWTYESVTVDLPADVANGGDIVFRWDDDPLGSGGFDDISIDNVILLTAATNPADTGHQVLFENDAAPVSLLDETASLGDVDDTQFEGATLRLTNAQSGDGFAINGVAVGDGDTGTVNGLSYTVAVAGPEILVTLTGSANSATYLDAMRGVQFVSSSGTPSVAARTVEIAVGDGDVFSNIATTTVVFNSTINAPSTNPDTATSAEDSGAIVVTVLANDTPNDDPIDPSSVRLIDGGALVTSLTVAGEGVWSVNTGTGTISFAPEAHFNGVVTPVQYSVADTSGYRSAPAHIAITVSQVNDAPLLDLSAAAPGNDYAVTYTENDPAVKLVATDVDLFDDFTNEGDLFSQLTVTMTGAAPTATESLMIITTPFAMNGDASGSIAVGGVPVIYDWVAATQTLTFTHQLGAGNSFTSAEAEGILRTVGYFDTSDDPTAGVRSFEITATDFTADPLDQLTSATATTTVTVVPVNDAPTDITYPSAILAENSTSGVVAVLAADDLDHGAVDHTFTLLGGPNTDFEIVGNELRLLPTASLDHEATPFIDLDVQVSDGIDTYTETVRVTITDQPEAPIANPPLGLTMSEDTGPIFIDVLAPAVDPDGDPISVIPGSVSSAQGLAVWDGSRIEFTPGLNFNGTASIDYQISDGTGFITPATVNVQVTPDNDVPVLDLNGVAPGNGHTVTHVEEAGAVALANGPVFSDPEEAIVALRITADVNPHGADDVLLLNGTAVPLDADAGFTLTTASLNVVVTYTAATRQMAITDLGGGVLDSAQVTELVSLLVYENLSDAPQEATPVNITVQAEDDAGNLVDAVATVTNQNVNDAPVLTQLPQQTTNEDTTIAEINVLGAANAEDADGDTLFVVNDASLSAINGTVVVTPMGNIRYTPNLNFNGTDTISYQVSDGTVSVAQTISVEVLPTNDAPLVDLNGPTIGTAYNATFNENAPAQIFADTALTVTDAEDEVAEIAIAVAGNADAPGDEIVGLLANTFTLSGPATLNTTYAGIGVALTKMDGSFTITPTAGPFFTAAQVETILRSGTYQHLSEDPTAGDRTFAVTLTDGDGVTLSNTAVGTLTVVPGIDRPTGSSFSTTVNEDTSAVFDVMASANDVDGTPDPTSVTIVGAPGAGKLLVQPGVGQWSVDLVSGAITFAPEADYDGAVPQISYTFNDDEGNALASPLTLDVSITPILDAPALDLDASGPGADFAVTFTENSPVQLLADVDAVLSDPEDEIDNIIIDYSALVDMGSEFISLGGNAFSGVANVSTTFLVSGVNARFSVNAAAQTMTITPNGAVHFTAAEAQTLLRALGYEHTSEDPTAGDRAFPITVTDGDGVLVSNTATSTVTVLPQADAPTGVDFSQTIAEEGVATFDVMASASDVDGTPDPTSVFIVGAPLPGKTFTEPGVGQWDVDVVTGVITFTPDENYNGTAPTVSYSFRDDEGNLAATSYDLDVTVTPVNDAPEEMVIVGNNDTLALNVDGGDNAYYFVNDGDIISNPLDPVVFGGRGSFTYEMTFSIADFSGVNIIPLLNYFTGGSFNDDEISLYISYNSGSPNIDIELSTGYLSNVAPADVLVDGEEHTLSFSWDNTLGDWALYIDGAPVADGTGIAVGETIRPNGQIVLGQEQDSVGGGFVTNEVFKGTIDDVRVFEDVRTPAEILANAGNTVAPTEPGLIANWQFQDTHGGTVTNQVSGGVSLDPAYIPTGAGFTASTISDAIFVGEDAAGGALVATLFTSDAETTNQANFNYTLTGGGGNFEIVGNEIRTTPGVTLDRETVGSYTLSVTVDDDGVPVESLTQTYQIVVQDANEAPTGLSVAGNEGVQINFNGGDADYFQVVDEDALWAGVSDFTLEFQIAIADYDLVAGRTSIYNQRVLANEVLDVRIDDLNGFPEITLKVNDIFYHTGANAAVLLDGGQHTLSVTREAATGEMVVYVDGTVVSTLTGVQPGFTIPTGTTAILGQDQDTPGSDFQTFEAFSGTYYDVRLFDTVRTPAEVLASANQTIAPTTSNLVANWTFDGATPALGGAMTDTTGNHELARLEVNGVPGGTGDPAFVANVLEDVVGVPADAAPGTVVATLSGTDPEGDALSYSIGSDATGSLEIVGNELRVSNTPSLDRFTDPADTLTRPPEEVVIRVTDSGGLTYDQTIQVETLLGTPTPFAMFGTPQVNGLTASGNTAYVYGQGSDDVITGGDGGVFLHGQDGSDILNGGDGNDILFGDRDVRATDRDGADPVANSGALNALSAGNVSGPVTLTLGDGNMMVIYYGDAFDASHSAGLYAQIISPVGTPIGPEIQVGLTTPGSNDVELSNSLETRPVTATVMANGNVMVSWMSNDSDNLDGAGSASMVSVIDVSAFTATPARQINTTTATDQSASLLTALPDGTVLAVWIDDAITGSPNAFVRAQVLRQDGTALGPEIALSTVGVEGLDGYNMPPVSVALLNSGQVAVSWVASGNAGGIEGNGTTGVQTTVVNPLTQTASTVQQVNTTEASNQSGPSVVALTDGRYMVVWYDFADQTSNPGMVLRGQIFNADGTANGSEIAISSTAVEGSDGTESPPVNVLALSNGNVVVGFQSEGSVPALGDTSGTASILVVVNTTAGTAGPEVRVNDAIATSQSAPLLVEIHDGRFLAVYYDEADNPGLNKFVKGQFFNADGTKSGAEFNIGIVATDGNNSHDMPPVSAELTANGDVFVAWQTDQASNFDGIGTAITSALITTRTTAGSDTLNGGDGNDILIGGAGADVLNGGEGTDTLSYSNAAAGVDVLLEDTDGFGLNGDYVLTAEGGQTGDAAGDSFSSIERFVGSAFDDRVFASLALEEARLGAGNDVLDTANIGGGVAKTLYGEEGDDDIFSGFANDTVYGGAGEDEIWGENGDDILFGGADNDLILGGDGADAIDGGAGNDTASFADATSGVVALFADTDNDGILGNYRNELAGGRTGFAAGDTYTSIETVIGSGAGDEFFIGAAQTTVYLGDGNDILETDLTDNTAQTIYGEEGVDIISSGGGDDFVSAGIGDDRVYAEGGNDILIGAEGNDDLRGQAGTDTAVYSGLQADYDVMDNQDGTYTVTDLRPGSPSGTDTLQTIEFLEFADVVIDITLAVTSVSPVAFDLNEDGEIGVTGETTARDKSEIEAVGETVQFDMDGDGDLETIEWLDGSGDGFLVENSDGQAANDMNGTRLFGDEGGAYNHGYQKLAQRDADGSGTLSGEELEGLNLWVDDGDAQVQEGELFTLADFEISEIQLQLDEGAQDSEGRDLFRSTATRTDGTQIMTEDVWFAGVTPEEEERMTRPDIESLERVQEDLVG
ncbi:MAG: tandem-95 repeat protein [Pseudomonadota bacterium]